MRMNKNKTKCLSSLANMCVSIGSLVEILTRQLTISSKTFRKFLLLPFVIAMCKTKCSLLKIS